MKVLHVITGLAAGGAETQLRQLLQHTRHCAEVVTLTNAGSVAAAIRKDGVPVINLNMRSNREPAALLRLAQILGSGQYDVVHTHLYRACVYGRLGAWLSRVPVIVATEHSLLDGQIEGRRTTVGVRSLYRASERLGDVTIAVSSVVRARLLQWGIAEDRVVHISNGIDLKRLRFRREDRLRVRHDLGLPTDAVVAGAVGRLDRWKNLDVVVSALAPMLRRELLLILVGDGPERKPLADLAQDLGVADRVIFAGERMDIGATLSAMDVFVSASLKETFGLAVLEALGNGLPVVYSCCPAVDELAAGVPLARRASGVEGIRAAVAESAAALGEGRVTPPQVESYSAVKTTAAIDNVYDHVLDRRKSQPTWRRGSRPVCGVNDRGGGSSR
jgi:glycosyltransferase involved in cell wall biosynthesis